MALKNLIGMNDKSSGRVENTSRAALPVPRTVAPPTAIDADTTLSGKLRCRDTLRIDGRVKGEVRCDKTVIIGECAVVEASIQAECPLRPRFYVLPALHLFNFFSVRPRPFG